MRALVVVDVQNDFLPGGALAVPAGDAIIPVVNALMARFALVVATQDWHPPHHGSFATQHPGTHPGEVITLDGLPQVLWPPHCVQHTPGADFAPGLETRDFRHRTRKGTNPAVDSYSGFFDNAHRVKTDLDDYLRAHEVDEVYLCGLATDYCVLYTALDARRLGYATVVVEDACRGLELQPGDIARAFAAMREAGATILRSDAVSAD